MQAAQCGLPCVAALRDDRGAGSIKSVDQLDGELVSAQILVDEEHRVDGLVHAAGDGIEVGERQLPSHCLAQRLVVGVVGVGSAPFVAEASVLGH
jgi:hypothetical protein